MVPGYEGSSKLVFTNIPQTTKTGFQIFLSDGINSATNFFLLSFILNKRPIVSTSTISSTIYPNLNLSINLTLDMDAYFTDPENQQMAYYFHNVPPAITMVQLSNSVYNLIGMFDSSVSNMSFTFTADDGVSLPRPVTIEILVANCDSKCDRCFGPTDHECYLCTGTNVLDTTTCTTECPAGKYNDNGI